jgi:hypothetical protein
MSYQVRYMESYSVLQGNRWVNKKREKWIPFYPIVDLLMDEYGDGGDKRPPEEVLKQDKIYGKAITGTAGYKPVYMYHTWPRKDVRLAQ